MAINEKDFSGFDELSIDEKLNMLYRLLCHVETEIDRLRKLIIFPKGRPD